MELIILLGSDDVLGEVCDPGLLSAAEGLQRCYHVHEVVWGVLPLHFGSDCVEVQVGCGQRSRGVFEEGPGTSCGSFAGLIDGVPQAILLGNRRLFADEAIPQEAANRR